ncbi:MAG TPA: futalosine hydrolase [Pedobacter sp.]|nr:futalosine hydrolase [Pedobacter sp.]
MKILIVSATRAEATLLYTHFKLPDHDFVQTTEFDIVITGVGMTATAFALGQRLSPKYSLVLNMGIAGSFDPAIPLGTVLNITEDEFAELGADDGDRFIGIEALGFGKSRFSTRHHLLSDVLTPLKKVRGITVNRVHGSEAGIAEVVRRLDPITESMEGAAVLYGCEQMGIPCLQVRSISNYVEPRNKENWKIGLAVKNLNDWVVSFLTNA